VAPAYQRLLKRATIRTLKILQPIADMVWIEKVYKESRRPPLHPYIFREYLMPIFYFESIDSCEFFFVMGNKGPMVRQGGRSD
jgi:hypothetical protein